MHDPVGVVRQVVFDWSGWGEGDANLLLFGLGAAILGFTLWILMEAVRVFSKLRQEPVVGEFSE